MWTLATVYQFIRHYDDIIIYNVSRRDLIRFQLYRYRVCYIDEQVRTKDLNPASFGDVIKSRKRENWITNKYSPFAKC